MSLAFTTPPARTLRRFGFVHAGAWGVAGGVVAFRGSLTVAIICWGLAAVTAAYAIWAPRGNLRPYQLAVVLLVALAWLFRPLAWLARRLGLVSGTSGAP